MIKGYEAAIHYDLSSMSHDLAAASQPPSILASQHAGCLGDMNLLNATSHI
jgi:hypothetical protein